MSDSNELMNKLEERAKEANERVHASATATKQKLESQVSAARTSVDNTNEQLKEKGAGAHDEASQRWSAARQSWSDHTAEIKRKADADKAEHDVHRAEHRAERAESDALAAIDFAILAVEEAEYEVLDAALARAEADELAAARV